MRLRSATAFAGFVATLLLASRALAGVAGAPGVVEEHRPHDDRVYEPQIESDFTALPGGPPTLRFTGVLEGAAYRIEVPQAGWNGRLMMWAHGYAGTGKSLRAGTPLIRRHLIEKGWAWAASSYRANHYDVRSGVEDTNALALAFNDIVAAGGHPLPPPAQIVIGGASMGGQITAAAIERETLATANQRVRYAGAMPICGVLGDRELFDFFGAYGLAAAQLAGFPTREFPIRDFAGIADELKSALWTAFPKSATRQGERLAAIVENLGGGKRPFFAEGFADARMQDSVWASLAGDGTLSGILTRSIVDTRGIAYRWTDPAQPATAAESRFDALIARATPASDANPPRRDGLRWLPRLDADFEVPVLSLHTLGDLYVPISMEQIYRQRAVAKGHDDLLVQREIRDVGHCSFTIAEGAQAFDDLVEWIDHGKRPAGDDVLDASALAAPTAGCRFTDNRAQAGDYADPAIRAAAQAHYPACPAR